MSETLPKIALSIQQPWAWLIASGVKDIENRTWPTKFRGRFLIHAGKKLDRDAEFGIAEATFYWPNKIEFPPAYKTGGFVGVAEIVGCTDSSKSTWFNGPWGFEIVRAEPIEFIPYRGALGFFPVIL